MNADPNLHGVSLAQLRQTCSDETRRYRRGETFDGRSCFELFRRAVCNRDQQAWEAVVDQYRGVVVTWVRRHPIAQSLAEDDDYWVNGAFARFFQAVSAEKFDNFAEVPQILRYLKLCVHSVIQDAVRRQGQQPFTVPIDDDRSDDAEPAPIDVLASGDTVDQSSNVRELWAAVQTVLHDDVERRVAYLTLVLEYKPREIQALHKDLFPEMNVLYRLIRNVLDRLQRSPEIREFLH